MLFPCLPLFNLDSLLLICRLLCSRLSACPPNHYVTLQAVEKAKARQAAIAARATARGSGRIDADDASSREVVAALLDDSDAESESDDDVDDGDDGGDDATEDNVAGSAHAPLKTHHGGKTRPLQSQPRQPRLILSTLLSSRKNMPACGRALSC